MQVAFQSENISEKTPRFLTGDSTPLGLLNSSSNFKTGQTSIQTHKSQNENYSNLRVYSPYLSPSSAVVIDMVARQTAVGPTYVHNEARTKYFNVSKPAKPGRYIRLNLFA